MKPTSGFSKLLETSRLMQEDTEDVSFFEETPPPLPRTKTPVHKKVLRGAITVNNEIALGFRDAAAPILGAIEGFVRGSAGFVLGGTASTVSGAYAAARSGNPNAFPDVYNQVNEEFAPLWQASTEGGIKVQEAIGDIDTYIKSKVSSILTEELIDRNTEITNSGIYYAFLRTLPEITSQGLILKGFSEIGKKAGYLHKKSLVMRADKKLKETLGLIKEKAQLNDKLAKAKESARLTEVLEAQRNGMEFEPGLYHPKEGNTTTVPYKTNNALEFVKIQQELWPSLSQGVAERLFNDYSNPEVMRHYIEAPSLRASRNQMGIESLQNNTSGWELGDRFQFTRNGASELGKTGELLTFTPGEFLLSLEQFATTYWNKYVKTSSQPPINPKTGKPFSTKAAAFKKWKTSLGTDYVSVQNEYIKYINSRIPDKVFTFDAAVARALDLRDFEMAQVKSAQELGAWAGREAGWKKVLEKTDKQLLQKLEARDTANFAADVLDGKIQNLIERAVLSVDDTPLPKNKGFGKRHSRSQRGSVDMDVFAEGIQKFIDEVKNLFNLGEESLTGTAREYKSEIAQLNKIISGINTTSRKPVLPEDLTAAIAQISKEPERKIREEKFEAISKLLLRDGDRPFTNEVAAAATFKNILDPLRERFYKLPDGKQASLSELSPAFAQIADEFRRPNIGTHKSLARNGIAYEQAIALGISHFTNKYKTITKGLSTKDKIAIAKRVRGIDVALSEILEKKAQELKQFNDEMYAYIKEVYQDKTLPYVDQYIHRIYTVGGKETTKYLEKKLKEKGLTEDKVHNFIEAVSFNDGKLRAASPWQLIQSNETVGIVRASSVDFERTAKLLSDADLAPILEHNPDKIYSRQIPDVVKRVEFSRRMGVSGEILNKLLKQGYGELKAKNIPLERWRVSHIVDMLNIIQGIPIKGTTQELSTLNRVITTALNIGLLSTAGLTSLHEPLLGATYLGLKAWAKSLPSTMGILGRKTMRLSGIELPKHETELLLEDISKASISASVDRLVSIFDPEYAGTNPKLKAVNTALGVVSKASFYANGLTYITNFSTILGANLFRRYWMEYFTALKDNNINKWRKTTGTTSIAENNMNNMLDFYGLDKNQGKAWAEQGFSRKHPFYDKFKAATHIFIDDVVLHPNKLNSPMWFNNPKLGTLRYLKGFLSTMWNVSWKNWYANAENNLLFLKDHPSFSNFLNTAQKFSEFSAVLAAMVGIQYLRLEEQDKLKYGTHGKNPLFKTQSERIIRAINTSGLLAQLSYVDDLLHYSYKGVVAPILGAPFSELDTVFTAGKALVKGNSRPTSMYLTKRIPYVKLLPKRKQDKIATSIQRNLFGFMNDPTEQTEGMRGGTSLFGGEIYGRK